MTVEIDSNTFITYILYYLLQTDIVLTFFSKLDFIPQIFFFNGHFNPPQQQTRAVPTFAFFVHSLNFHEYDTNLPGPAYPQACAPITSSVRRSQK